ncbi:MAG: response regulator [Chloroflexi bacterium]|nr:response regulator [Chloroflexota bacterium]
MNTSRHPATILVVDDERAYREAIADVLRSQGHTVLVAESAGEALKALELATPELIMLDVMMPGVDGLTLVRHLASDPRFLSVPLIMASAKAMPADRFSAWERGASAYLVKPFTFEEVTSLIEYWLAPPEPDTARVELVDLADRLASV